MHTELVQNEGFVTLLQSINVYQHDYVYRVAAVRILRYSFKVVLDAH